ncbi:MAG: HAMP domain-containing sensor histidine kinase [Sphingomicrobium sp.]
MKRFRNSAAYRIAFVYSAAIAVGIAVLGLIVYWAMHVAFTRQLDATIQDEADTMILEYHDGGSAELATAIKDHERLITNEQLYYAVFQADGRRSFGSLHTKMPAAGFSDVSFADPADGTDSARALAIDLPDRSRLVIAADREWIEQIDHTVLETFLAGFVAVVALGIVGALLLGGYLKARLTAIGSAAEAIIGGDLSQRMPTSARDDEFDQLASLLNSMLDTIKQLLDNLRQVSSDVAHDLRTPLTRLRNALEQSARAPGNADAQRAVIADGISRVDDILSLFAAILRISEVESGRIRRFFAPFDLSALISDLAESYAPPLQENGQTLDWSVEPGLIIAGDRELIAQAVINLLENAQRHTPAGTAIHVALARAGKTVRIRVADGGPGVSTDDRAIITRRFSRLEHSRSSAGQGLGLNLVAAIVGLHRGELQFSDNQPGLVVEIRLLEDAS